MRINFIRQKKIHGIIYGKKNIWRHPKTQSGPLGPSVRRENPNLSAMKLIGSKTKSCLGIKTYLKNSVVHIGKRFVKTSQNKDVNENQFCQNFDFKDFVSSFS
jgi:hypothetical protein